jgi:Mrp family chromosome partitioning ATPase/capsular polysaccharide biosynthesis protein
VSVTSGPSAARREPVGEERVEVRRYLDALSRSRWTIFAVVLLMTGIVVAVSLLLPDTYRATTRLVFEQTTTAFGESDEASTRRRLATTETLLTSQQVLDTAARRVPGAEDGDDIGGKVTSSVEDDANIINISGSDEDPETAARIANAVAVAFLSEREEVESERLARARQQLEDEIIALQGAPNAAVQIGAIRERISELAVGEASAGADLTVAERAEPPSEPASPRPVRNGVLAFFGSLFLAILFVLGRDQLTPRVSGPRELGRLLDLPVLIGVPHVGGRRGRRRLLSGVELEAYQTLRSSIELTMPSERRQHQILMTGALHAEGKTTATARLGRAMAQAGHSVLLVSADLRVPKLHAMFNLPLGVGLADILAVLDWDTKTFDDDLVTRATHEVIGPVEGTAARRGELHVITSGTKAKDPGRLVAGPAMKTFLEHVRGLDYDYVLIDAPPLLGIADSQALARYVDDLLLVNRLDRLTLEHVNELRDVIDRLHLRPLGIVVIGARGEISPYYMQRRPGLFAEDEAQTAP